MPPRKNIAIFLVLVCAVAASWLFWRASCSSESEIERVEALPATLKISDDQKGNSNGIVFLRLGQAREGESRSFGVLESRAVVDSVKGLDATGCRDFGDDQLACLLKATKLEYLGLSGCPITDLSVDRMRSAWPRLRFLDVQDCAVTKMSILRLLEVKKLVFVEVSADLNDREFRDGVHRVSPNTIVMCDGKDVMEQPDSAFDAIPWSDWE